MNFLNTLWTKLRSNPYFIAFSGAAVVGLTTYVHQDLADGHMDFTKEGLSKALSASVMSGLAAVIALHQPTPKAAAAAAKPDDPAPHLTVGSPEK